MVNPAVLPPKPVVQPMRPVAAPAGEQFGGATSGSYQPLPPSPVLTQLPAKPPVGTGGFDPGVAVPLSQQPVGPPVQIPVGTGGFGPGTAGPTPTVMPPVQNPVNTFSNTVPAKPPVGTGGFDPGIAEQAIPSQQAQEVTSWFENAQPGNELKKLYQPTIA